jgi:isopentenyl-diphosphate delta-isomerase
VVKETGCGLSRRTALRLRDAGVRHIDVGGAGGTSWVGVEALRLNPEAAALGQELWDWGIPTAASVAASADLGLEIIATGGLRNGTDVAAALSLGARVAGFAAPLLRAHTQGGAEGAATYLDGVIASLRAHVFLAGCASANELARCPKLVSPLLETWIASLQMTAPGADGAGAGERSA